MSSGDRRAVSVSLGGGQRATLAAVADALIPAAHGMPSAGLVLDSARLEFVLGARSDLQGPLSAALRPELGDVPSERLAALEAEPEHLAALHLVVVAGYYTDAEVRALIGYPGQLARPVNAFDFPEYVAEGLVERVVERGPIWRDPGDARVGN